LPAQDNLFNHFNTLYGTINDTTTQNTTHIHDSTQNNEQNNNQESQLNAPFTTSDLQKAVFAQNSGKSPGPDQLPAELFKYSFHLISPILLDLYNKIFTKEQYI
jgi:hypothetical protein